MRPVRAKALIINAFALAGRFASFQSVHPRRCLGLCACWAFSPYNWVLTHPPRYGRDDLIALWVAHTSRVVVSRMARLPSVGSQPRRPSGPLCQQNSIGTQRWRNIRYRTQSLYVDGSWTSNGLLTEWRTKYAWLQGAARTRASEKWSGWAGRKGANGELIPW